MLIYSLEEYRETFANQPKCKQRSFSVYLAIPHQARGWHIQQLSTLGITLCLHPAEIRWMSSKVQHLGCMDGRRQSSRENFYLVKIEVCKISMEQGEGRPHRSLRRVCRMVDGPERIEFQNGDSWASFCRNGACQSEPELARGSRIQTGRMRCTCLWNGEITSTYCVVM